MREVKLFEDIIKVVGDILAEDEKMAKVLISKYNILNHIETIL